LDERLAGYWCTDEQLVAPLNSLGGCDDANAETTAATAAVVDARMIRRAFFGDRDHGEATWSGKELEFSVPYRHLGIGEGGEGVLHTRRLGNRGRGGGILAVASVVGDDSCVGPSDFGYFDSDIASRLSREEPPGSRHPLDFDDDDDNNRPSRWFQEGSDAMMLLDAVPTDVRGRLKRFLTKEQAVASDFDLE
jgi:hypothetical protein